MTADFDRYPPALYPAGGAISLIRPYGGFLGWYHAVVLVIALSVIYANLPIYAYIRHPGLLPKYFFFGLFFLFSPLLLMKSRALSVYLTTPFALWASLLIVLNLAHVASFAWDSGTNVASLINIQMEEQKGQIATRTQYIVFAWFLGFAVFASSRQSYRRAFAFLAVLLPCLIMLDFARPGLFYPIDLIGAVLGRASAMFINPTMAAEAILLVFIFACAVTKMKYRIPLFLLLGVGILVTFTRSAIIAWLLLGPLLIFARILPKSAIAVMSVVLGTALLFVGVFESYLGSRQDFGDAVANLQARLDFFSNVKLTDDSSQERAEVIRAGWDLFIQNPVFGAGAGATQFWTERGSTHNQLLMLAAEYGIFGIGLWLWMVTILWRGEFFENRNLQFAIAFLFVFMSMFTHQMLDSASYWLASFALASVKRRKVLVYGSGRLA